MSYNRNTVIVGYGGHAFSVIDAYNEMGKGIKYYTSIKEIEINPFKLEYLGFELDLNFAGWGRDLSYILGIGDNNTREKVAQFILSHSKSILQVVHPNSSVSKLAKIGTGVFVSNGVIVNAFAEIGDYTILNTSCVIEHECVIGRAAHIAPGAVLAGNVNIGERSFIGANSVIKQGVTIGDDVIIGAGSVILDNVENNQKVVGNPARIIL